MSEKTRKYQYPPVPPVHWRLVVRKVLLWMVNIAVFYVLYQIYMKGN